MSVSKPKVVFAGTPPFAAQHLQALINAKLDIVGVYTQPDRPGKRGKVTPSAVKQLAVAHELPVYQPLNFKHDDDVAQLQALAPDILIVVAYGLILPQSVLDIPKLAPINVHASLLPRWRGAAPIERAIEAGDTETGVGIMVMEAGLDTGPILSEAQIPIGVNTTGDELREQLATLGCEQLLECITALSSGNAKATAQAKTGVSYAHKLARSETALDWHADATVLHNKVRAFNASNVATFNIDETRIKLWRTTVIDQNTAFAPGTIISHEHKHIQVQCGSGVLSLMELQLPGKKALSSADILNGKAALFAIGTVLT